MTVRLANIGDTDRIVTMMADAFPESPFAEFCEFSPAMARRQFLQHLAAPTSLCLVHAPASDARGLFVVTAADHPSAPLRMCLEVVKWIEPSCRGKAWLRMLRWAERWAKEKGCTISTISGLDCPGYEPVETHYVKVL